MELDIISPAFYPDESYIRYFLASAKRHHVPVRYYGMGHAFTTWIDSHITKCIDYLRTLRSSHVLFTDSVDALFLAPQEEIIAKYEQIGRPDILLAWEKSGINGGGWIGERRAMIDALEILQEFDSGDPQERWREAAGIERLDVTMDITHRIFQVVDGSNLKVELAAHGKSNLRIHNIDNDSWPCILHCAGGGKDERMEPWLKQLGYK